MSAWEEIGPTAYIIEQLEAQARGETIDQTAVGEAAQAAAVVMFVDQGIDLDVAIEKIVGRDCHVNCSLKEDGTLEIQLEWPPPPEITEVHQLIAETLAAGGPVADELDAASDILDALYCFGIVLHHNRGDIEWPDADYHCPEDRPDPLALEAGDEDEDRCPHCGGEADDPENHTDACPTLDTCAQCEPLLDPPWHPEAEWWDADGGESYSEAFRRHLREAHGRTR